MIFFQTYLAPVPGRHDGTVEVGQNFTDGFILARISPYRQPIL